VQTTLRMLAQRVAALEQRVAALEQAAAPEATIDTALRRRGWAIAGRSGTDRLLLPRSAEPAAVDGYYAHLRHYHFRRLLQELVEQRTLTPAAVRRLEERWGARAVGRTFDRLAAYGLLVRRPEGLRLATAHVRAFGDTLEWFVAQVFLREFAAPAAWDVRIRRVRKGGDFDVLVLLDGRLGYVECKASPPYNVSADVLAGFLERVRGLAPDFTILVIDTTLLVDRNIIDNLTRLLQEAGVPPPVTRAAPGVYQMGRGVPLFVVTSRRSLVANLALCLRRLHGAREE